MQNAQRSNNKVRVLPLNMNARLFTAQQMVISFFHVSVLWQLRTEQDPIKKEEMKVKIMKETIPFYLSKFEKIVSENDGFSVGNNVSSLYFLNIPRSQRVSY